MKSISRVWLSWQLLSAAGPFLNGLVFSSLSALREGGAVTVIALSWNWFVRCLGCLLVLGLLLNLKRFNMYVVVFLSSGIDQKAKKY